MKFPEPKTAPLASRRAFLGSLVAAVLSPLVSWAGAGSPRFLAAARIDTGDFVLCGLDEAGNKIFSIPLPGRGHAAAAHPERAEAVAFARRPGNFALVLDCGRAGSLVARLEAPPDRHFFGHGVFSQDGSILFTTENAFELGEGRIGVWDAGNGYKRIGEFSSGGVGPHEVTRLPGTDVLVVANGGIETHPSTGRTKLNLATMEPNLCYLSATGEVLETVDLHPDLRLLSIRHLAVRRDGTVAAACQWQGDVTASPELMFLHKQGEAPRVLTTVPGMAQSMAGYAGSVAFAGTGQQVAFSAPRGGQVALFDTDSGAFLRSAKLEDACGLATTDGGLCVTTGMGLIGKLDDRRFHQQQHFALQFDNHLVPIDKPV